MAPTVMNIRVDSDLKERAGEVVRAYGLDLSTATRMFYAQIAHTGTIPLSLSYAAPNAESLESVRDAEAFFASGREGRFDNAEDLIAAALS